MFAAYLDDSGSQKEGPVFVMAGFVAGWSAWMSFSEEWQAALDREPKLAYFKIKEALRLEEQFGRFTERQRDERCLELFSIIERRVDFSVVTSMRWDGYEKVRRQYPEIPILPYQALVMGSMSTIMTQIFKAMPSPRMYFVFDDHKKEAAVAERSIDAILPALLEKEQQAFMGLSHMDDREILPLQAADSIAWLMRRHAFENPNGAQDLGDWKPNRRYFNPLARIPRLITYYPEQRLTGLFEMYAAEQRNQRAQR
jgi:Protein of unknown function (DUF3800)